MKIGILTHQYINNYGAFLQAYALQETVRELFPRAQVYMIRYVNMRHWVINTCGWFRFFPGRENGRIWREKIRVPGMFARERRRWFCRTGRCFTVSGINRLGMDCIVIGSDEVWNYQDWKVSSRAVFGWGLTCRTVVAYAPSVGNAAVAERMPGFIRRGLKNFSSFSVRDALTDEFLKKLTGKGAERVLDPTFLFPIPSGEPAVLDGPFLLFYYCDGLPEAMLKECVAWARGLGYAVYGAGEGGTLYDRITVNLTPFQWAGMFQKAEFVLTGTFHGAVFSLLNERQFACFLSNQSRKAKVDDLLGYLGLGSRILTGISDVRRVFQEKIDYRPIREIFDRQRQASLRYLRESIGAAERR